MMFKYMCLVLFITWYQLADCHPARSDVKSIDSMIDKESEAFLSVEADASSQNKAVRDKRTIGFLRQLFPNFSQIVDRKIQQITRFLFRVVGRLVLRGGAGGGAGAGAGGTAAGGGGSEAGGNGGRRISITLPTFPPSADDEEEEQSSTDAPASATPESIESRVGDASDSTSPPAVADSAAAASADSAADTAAVTTEATAAVAVTTEAAAAAASVTTVATITTTSAGATNAAAAVTTQMPSDSDNTVGTVVKRTAREASTEKTSSAQKRSPLTDTENNEASSDDNALQSTNDDETPVPTEEDPRNKRFLFNLRGGGGGGSGNFLFDLIRLVAGSGANQDRDEAVDSGDATPLETENQEVRADLNGKEDGYSVGVPGPLTRIFVIANRGVANLVQDLILRLAQTTERIVNFKARLITSLI